MADGNSIGAHRATGTCAEGLHFMHWGALVVSGQARIGRNCRIHMGVNIGASRNGAPRLGDNVYIGPGAKLFGDIQIGDNVKIGANSVVKKSFPSNVVIAGVPAKIIRYVSIDDEANFGAES